MFNYYGNLSQLFTIFFIIGYLWEKVVMWYWNYRVIVFSLFYLYSVFIGI